MLLNKSDTCRKFIQQIMNHELEIQSIYNENYNDIHQIIALADDGSADTHRNGT